MLCKKKCKLTPEIESDPSKYSEWLICSIGAKADKNKFWSRLFTVLSVLLSSGVLFILLFEERTPASIFAGGIALINAAVLAWMQLEKPHERWRLYRKYHRMAEAERMQFLHKLEPYDSGDPEKILVNRLMELQRNLHYEWDGLIPSSEDLKYTQKGT